MNNNKWSHSIGISKEEFGEITPKCKKNRDKRTFTEKYILLRFILGIYKGSQLSDKKRKELRNKRKTK